MVGDHITQPERITLDTRQLSAIGSATLELARLVNPPSLSPSSVYDDSHVPLA